MIKRKFSELGYHKRYIADIEEEEMGDGG